MADQETQVHGDELAVARRRPVPDVVDAQDHVAAVPEAGPQVHFFALVPLGLRRRGQRVVQQRVRRHHVAAMAQARRLRPGLEVVGGEGRERPPGGVVRAALAVDVVAAVVADQAGLLQAGADRVVRRLGPVEAVGAVGDGELVAVRLALEDALEAPRRVRVVRLVYHRQGGEVAAAGAQVDDVVVRAAVELDQSQVGLVPVRAVGAGGVAAAKLAAVAAVRVDGAPGQVPHMQLAVDRDDRAVEAGAEVVRRPRLAGSDDDGVGPARDLAGDELQPEPRAERATVAVEREQDRLFDDGVGNAVLDGDHGVLLQAWD